MSGTLFDLVAMMPIVGWPGAIVGAASGLIGLLVHRRIGLACLALWAVYLAWEYVGETSRDVMHYDDFLAWYSYLPFKIGMANLIFAAMGFWLVGFLSRPWHKGASVEPDK